MTKNELWGSLVEFYYKNGRCPQPNELAEKCKVSINAVTQVYDSWRLEQKLDCVKPINTSVFYYNLSEKTENEVIDAYERKPKNTPRIDSNEPKAPKEYKETTKPKHTLNFDVFKGIWLKLFCLVIAGILLICSIHFTFEFNHKSMNVFWAMMLSLSICGFNGFAFSIADTVKGKSKNVIFTMWVIGTVYSVITAIGTQYNNFMEFKSNDVSVVISNQRDITEKQIAQLQKKADVLYTFREQELEYNQNPDLKIENRGTWKIISNRVEELNNIENEILDLQNKLIDIAMSDSENVKNKTVYSWLEDITKTSADFWQFLVMCFPAVFIDLTVSVLIKFVFEKERKNENKTTKSRSRRK